ncbi:hypothetical protein GCM10023185_33110 [Hymenobacter saemangeumensis]|uniref:DUF4831 family protein n=2 Tax=Hymenobacter saemangeumensis TaxID=1084522 RepID=A0ABP8IN49_9BACT
MLIYFGMLSGCASVHIVSSALPETKKNLGYYYLPQKTIEAVVTVTATFERKYPLDQPYLLHYPSSKRHYKLAPKPDVLTAVKYGDDVSFAFRTDADPTKAFWLSTADDEDKAKDLNLLDLGYNPDGSHLLKSVSASLTPAGPQNAATALKIGVSIVTAAAKLAGVPALGGGVGKSRPPAWQFLPADSVVTVTKQYVLRKHSDLRAKENAIRTTTGAEVFYFDSSDLSLPAPAAPGQPLSKLEVWVVPATDAAKTQPFQTVLGQDFTKFGSSAADQPVGGSKAKGLFYRTPYVCDVVVKLVPVGTLTGPISTIAYRTSFPQLGAVALAPAVFSSKTGKQTTTIEFNLDNGGLTHYKVEKERSTAKLAEEAGTAATTLLNQAAAARDANSELQQLKDDNALLAERIKQLESQKKLQELQGAP